MFAAAATAVVVSSLAAKGVSAQAQADEAPLECSGMCTYQVTADMVWTAKTHPTDFPPSDDPAHFSPLWIVSHDLSFVFWRNDGLSLAMPGIQMVAETGGGDDFLAEAGECEDAGSCGTPDGFMCGDGVTDGVCQAQGEFTVTPGYPYVSCATMAAPSPDWFTGVSDVNLCVNGMFVESYEAELFPYDAGTDSGVTFLAEDEVTSPPQPISAFSTIEPQSDSIFYNPDLGETLPLGYLRMVRLSCDDDAATPPRADVPPRTDVPPRAAMPPVGDCGGLGQSPCSDGTCDAPYVPVNLGGASTICRSPQEAESPQGPIDPEDRVGAVYVMTNDLETNEIAVFGRMADGKLYSVGNFATGGRGSTEFDGDEGLDPLISADSIVVTPDEKYLITVNAGSDTVVSFAIRNDYTLELLSTVSSGGVGPNSVAVYDGLVFVTNIDRDGVAFGEEGAPRGEPNDEGNVVSFYLSETGQLTPTGHSYEMDNRPANIGFSSDGARLIVTSINAGSAVLPGELSEASVYSFVIGGVRGDTGEIKLVDTATSTLRDNEEGRNLPTAIDFDISIQGDREFIVVTEAREFNSDGEPPAFPALQAGSVSVYELNKDSTLTITEGDFSVSDTSAENTFGADGQQLTGCWIDFASDESTFYVSNAISATLSSFKLNKDGTLTVVEEVAAAGTSAFTTPGEEVDGETGFGLTDGFLDLDVSNDGKQVYVLAGLSGLVYVYDVADDYTLSLSQVVEGALPEIDTQGLVSI